MLDYLGFQVNLARSETVSAYDELPLWSAMAGLLLLENVPLGDGIRALDVKAGPIPTRAPRAFEPISPLSSGRG